jgi:hypothetical protein
MTHRGGLGLSIIIWRMGGAQLPFGLGPKNSLGGPATDIVEGDAIVYDF